MSRESPVIFIPGILGSTLYSPDDKKTIWFSAPAILADASRLDIRSPLTVKNNGIDQQPLSPIQREYGVMNQNIIVIEWLCRTMPERPIYFFSYDFRRSCREAAAHLHKMIEEIGAESVSVVCHSMGGLVTSSYAADYGTEKLDTVVMLGVPFEGSFEVLRMYLTGDVREIPNAVAETVGITREMMAGYPGLAELMPTTAHLAAHPIEYYGKPLTQKKMETEVSSLIPETYEGARMFQDFVKAGYKKLLEKSDCFFGIGYGKTTLQALSLTQVHEEPERIENQNGDGLVPCYSSTIGGELLKFLDEKNPRLQAFSVNHGNLIRAPEALKWISERLKGE